MSCEIPVVATAVGGVPEVVEDGVTGYLAGVGDIQALAQGAIRILWNENLRDRMGRAGRKRVLELFHMDRITDQYIALYERVINSEDDCP